MIGPPGAGKSMLAARLPSILPPLNARELLDVSMIQSIAGEQAGGASRPNEPPESHSGWIRFGGNVTGRDGCQ
jgi:magnesium chelatase family protein